MSTDCRCGCHAELTPGQQAMREVARLEAARVYGHTAEADEPASLTATVAEAELTARAPDRRARVAGERDIADAIRAGLSISAICEQLGASYAAVRAVRKRIMGEVA
jgi:DNA-binding NarL/FixJ family response regulator